uniref:Uncharacterized protein n=1 Tax=Phlebotomus papatasi TaxID=29031 RepID=A0A1B0DB79_PHLPP
MDLLHPNLLTNEQIVAILKERHLDISNIAGTSREELVRLYKSFIMPQPCRRAKERGIPENGNSGTEAKDCLDRDQANGERKRKHNRITFSEGDTKSKEICYKVKRTDDKPEILKHIDTEVTQKRRISSENSSPQNPHTKRKKITWP